MTNRWQHVRTLLIAFRAIAVLALLAWTLLDGRTFEAGHASFVHGGEISDQRSAAVRQASSRGKELVSISPLCDTDEPPPADVHPEHLAVVRSGLAVLPSGHPTPQAQHGAARVALPRRACLLGRSSRGPPGQA